MMKTSTKKSQEVIYHFTSLKNIALILRSGHLAPSGSNLNIAKGNVNIVWLTSAPSPENHGLGGCKGATLDKKTIRITIKFRPHFESWDEWSDKKGIKAGWKEAFIALDNSEKTYKTWYISEQIIPFDDFIKIENILTGEEIPIPKVPVTPPPKPIFRYSTDQYIFDKGGTSQMILLYTRDAIRTSLPNASEKMSDGIPAYFIQGKMVFAFSVANDHLKIHAGTAAIEHFASRLTGYKTSDGIIQFPYDGFGITQVALITEIAAWCGNND